MGSRDETHDTIQITQVIRALPDDIDRLRAASLAEDQRHVARLIDEWATGTQCFDQPGEALLAATGSAGSVAIGGMTRDPWVPGALRMRRFYVLPSARRRGIAERLARTLIDRSPTTPITAHAPSPLAITFWQAMGFQPCVAENHNLIFVPNGL